MCQDQKQHVLIFFLHQSQTQTFCKGFFEQLKTCGYPDLGDVGQLQGQVVDLSSGDTENRAWATSMLDSSPSLTLFSIPIFIIVHL